VAPSADIPRRYGPHTTCVNRFSRWRKAAVQARILEAVSEAYEGDIQMIDSSSIRVHQHGGNAKKKTDDPFSGETVHWTVSVSLKPWVARAAA